MLQVYRQHHIKQLVDRPVLIQWPLARDRERLTIMKSRVYMEGAILRRLKIHIYGMIVIQVLLQTQNPEKDGLLADQGKRIGGGVS